MSEFSNFDFAEQETGRLRSYAAGLKNTMDNPEVKPEDKLDIERELGHAVFELWARNHRDNVSAA